MAVFKSPTPPRAWPTTECTAHLLVTSATMPTITASASIIRGAETVFAHLEVDDMPRDRARHAVRVAVSGPRAAVLAVLADLEPAVAAARPEIPEGSPDDGRGGATATGGRRDRPERTP